MKTRLFAIRMFTSALAVAALVIASWVVPLLAQSEAEAKGQFVDLSLLVAQDLPGNWPEGPPPFQINHYLRIGPASAYNSDILIFDDNTATQFDAPAHGPITGPLALRTNEKVPVWQFVGEACVIDGRNLLDTTPNGYSSLYQKEHVVAWEKKYRPLGTGDVVLFRSDYSDKYYRPFPEGRRFIADPIDGKSPAYPAPHPDCLDYLGSRQVMTTGLDSPSMGPIPDMANITHSAGLQHGMVWTEGATHLGKLPVTGAFYCMIGPKTTRGIGASIRAFAIVGDSPAKWLIGSARKKQVVDLSVTLHEDLPVSWPGVGVGNSRYPYSRTLINSTVVHLMDSHAGTHLVPPSYALPPKGFDNQEYAPEVQQWLAEYERKYGPRGSSDITTEKVPISQTCGWARIIDVAHLRGTTDERSWPGSPEITPAHIQKYEQEHGQLRPGEIVIFRSGYSDTYFHPFEAGTSCMAKPLEGKKEGWPSPGPDTILYLNEKGIRCVATDGPTLGGAEPKKALMTYWALGNREMVGVEYLTNLGTLPEKAYFIFAALKIRGCHGGPGRAIALY
jgi:kynurenine formamidase